jgi:RNA polymerase sigma factor (sigma-70 family)
MKRTAEQAAIRAVKRSKPWFDVDDISQEAAALLLEYPSMSYLDLRYKLMDIFRSPRWSDSYKGMFLHLSYVDNEQWDGYYANNSPEQIYNDDMAVGALIKVLSRYEKNLLELYYWAGYTQEEIHEQLDIAISTVNLRLHKALKKIRKAERRRAIMTERTPL